MTKETVMSYTLICISVQYKFLKPFTRVVKGMINILSHVLYPGLTYSFSHILSAYMISLSYMILTTLTSFIFSHKKLLLCLLERFLYLNVIQFQLHRKSSTKMKFKRCMNREVIKMETETAHLTLSC